MNKVVTDGVVLMPPRFADGLDVWSSGDGTPGSDTYDTDPNASVVTGDADFGTCLELVKSEATQKIRFTGETPLLPGCYLEIRARVKAVSGNLPSVRVAGWAGGAGGVHVSGLAETGPAIAIAQVNDVVEIRAIIGPGTRGGVDMPWGTAPLYGHFGLDLTGATGGTVRVSDVEIADVTSYFLRNMLGIVDVMDYGATGDGTTDDGDAFQAANDDAHGRKVLVPAGTFFVDKNLTFDVPVIFEGTLTMPVDKRLILTRNFDLPSYVAAFGDEETAFKKAFQALLNNADHDSIDLGGRRINITAPIDMQAAVPNKTSYSTRRVIRNGQLNATGASTWDATTVTSQASYSSSDAWKLTDVANVANVPVGALVEGNGIGREVYVAARNVGAQELTLSAPLYGAAGSQTYTFRDFKYLLDFSGFSQLSGFELVELELQCNGLASGIRLAPSGESFAMHNCLIAKPRDRGITSCDSGCQDLLIDNCQFLSNEEALDVANRETIALNTNSDNVKLHNNRASQFLHFAVIGGQNNLVVGNHLYQGDTVTDGVRSAGIVLTASHVSSSVTANFIEDCCVEWTNERDAIPDFVTGNSFAGFSFTGNVCQADDVATWFSFLIVRPHGSGHFLNGVSVADNVFRATSATIDRAERVDASFAPLDHGLNANVAFSANTFHRVATAVSNPHRVLHAEPTAAQSWAIDLAGKLPFNGQARRMDALIAEGPLETSANETRHAMPYVETLQGAGADQINLMFEEAVKGQIAAIVRMDA